MKKYLPDLKQFWISDYKKINICVCQSTRSSCLLCLFSLFSWPICLPVFFSYLNSYLFYFLFFFCLICLSLSLFAPRTNWAVLRFLPLTAGEQCRFYHSGGNRWGRTPGENLETSDLCQFHFLCSFSLNVPFCKYRIKHLWMYSST